MLRRLDEPSARVVRGTDDGRSPFFSPDGQWLGFVTERAMYKVPVDGGVPVFLAPGSFWTPRAVWTDERTILAQSNDFSEGNGGLRAVDADEGTVTILTVPDRARGEVAHAWPLPLSDGRVLFNVVDSSRVGRLALYDPATDEYRVFETQAFGPFDYRDGQLTFRRAGQMFRARFDVDTGTLAASPVLVLEDADPVHLAIARNGTAVFMHFSEVGGQRMVRVDRQGDFTPLVTGSASYRGLRLAPDGKRVVSGLVVNYAGDQIWVTELGSERRWQLGGSGANSTDPVWSPDGSMVAHSWEREGRFDLYWQPADGSGTPSLLTALPFDQWPSSFSPDGRMLMFYGGANGTDIWTAMIDGSAEPVKIISSEASQRGGRFSPDGRYVAYYSDESGPWEVYVQPYPELDRRWVVSSSGGVEPVWAADGSELFFRDGTRMLSVAVTLTPEFTVGAETLLFESLMWSDPFSYDVFGDGQSFAMYRSDAAGEPRLRVLTRFSTLFDAAR